MKVLLVCCAALALLLGTGPGAVGQGKAPPPEAKALWAHITQGSPYTSWGSWPDYQGAQRARSPHGPMNRVFVNQAGLDSAKPPVAHGTIEVKAVENAQGKLKGLVVMYKFKGYNPKAGDWFWVRYSPEGQVMAEGKPTGCIRCHSVLADNDYIMVHYFR
ncbi:MAG: cytochrome P460 family protein [Desulfarculaceae bacterium]|nr:cytochrome P460 family protein [Desulfarculaceae bacterium]MCF8072005.1 cytochrome P460 family protein [Desulfarculaceae bacterium]MCF8101522.1 cytochrome P460 family protein [Desulfarculaceae bacterium]MCF8115072.1 cytochrome P460 family protein [Desulfarculaceae bacterium]